MRLCVCFHSCADIISLSVCYNEHSLALCISYSSFKCSYALPAVHLIVGCLRLYSRNYIAKRIYKSLVELKKCFCCAFECLSVFLVCSLPDIFWNIIKLRVKTCYCRVVHFLYAFDKSVKLHIFRLRLIF